MPQSDYFTLSRTTFILRDFLYPELSHLRMYCLKMNRSIILKVHMLQFDFFFPVTDQSCRSMLKNFCQ